MLKQFNSLNQLDNLIEMVIDELGANNALLLNECLYSNYLIIVFDISRQVVNCINLKFYLKFIPIGLRYIFFKNNLWGMWM